MSKSRFYTDEFLDKMRKEGDPLADELIEEIFASGEAAQVHRLMATLNRNDRKIPSEFPALREYFEKESLFPSWADPEKMRRGTVFFAKYQSAIMSLLGFLSLPYCYAAANGAQILYLSEKIRKNTRRRLTETASFVLDVTAPNAFKPEGAGLVSTLKVRLMHATVRHHVLRSKEWKPEWGFPVNQEDMSGTNGAFSWLTVRGLRKMGHFVEPNAAEDFYHLWNVIGVLMGLREELLPDTVQEAYALDRKIAQRHFRKSEAGVELTKALLEVFQEKSSKSFTKGFPEAYMRFLLGDRVADLLDIPASNWTQSLLNPLRLSNNWRSFLGQKPSNGMTKIIRDALAEEQVGFQIPLSLS